MLLRDKQSKWIGPRSLVTPFRTRLSNGCPLQQEKSFTHDNDAKLFAFVKDKRHAGQYEYPPPGTGITRKWDG